jgi:hypothetical protein
MPYAKKGTYKERLEISGYDPDKKGLDRHAGAHQNNLTQRINSLNECGEKVIGLWRGLDRARGQLLLDGAISPTAYEATVLALRLNCSIAELFPNYKS